MTDRPASVLRLAAPLVVSFWMRAGFTLVDTIFASRLGDAAVAAIGLAVPFEFLMIAVWVGLSTGLTSGASRAIGAREGGKLDQYVAAAWRMTAAVVALFVAIGVAIRIAAPRLHVEGDVARSFAIYGSVLVAGNALTSFWSIVPDSLVKAHHDTHATMWAGIFSEVCGVVLNVIFMFGLHLGIFGIALSDVLGKLAGLAYALRAAGRLEAARRARESGDLRARDLHPYKAILALAIPSSITFSLMAVESGIVNAVLGSFPDAKAAMAAFSIYFRVSMFALQPILALGVAMLPFAARAVGAGDLGAVRRALREAGLAAAAYALVVVGAVALAAGPAIARGLAESPVTERYAAFALRLTPLACLAAAPFILCRSVFEALRRGLPGMVMAIVRYAVLTGPVAWLGIHVARALDRAPLFGLVPALVGVALATSAVFALWTRAMLGRAGTMRG